MLAGETNVKFNNSGVVAAETNVKFRNLEMLAGETGVIRICGARWYFKPSDGGLRVSTFICLIGINI